MQGPPAPIQSPRHRVRASPYRDVVSYSDGYPRTQHADPAGWLHYVWLDPSVPYVVLLWVQLLVNVLVVCATCYVAWHLCAAIAGDIARKRDLFVARAVHEIAQCSREYSQNCAAALPALARVCSEWRSCMGRNPHEVGLAMVSASVVGEVLNEFFLGLSWKTLFGMSILLAQVVLLNIVMAAYRRAPTQALAKTH